MTDFPAPHHPLDLTVEILGDQPAAGIRRRPSRRAVAITAAVVAVLAIATVSALLVRAG